MKIAAYAICKNEEKFVRRFMEACKDFDGVFVLDTGSTDGSVGLLASLGATVCVKSYNPWRFDVARNDALALVPEDYDACFSLDLDEVLEPGWRPELERVWATGVNRPRYRFNWNHKPDGSPDIWYYADKIHARHGYRWRLPVHELLTTQVVEKQEFLKTVVINHRADLSKSRSSYLPLLELARQEEPDNDRMAHYLGREYFNYGMLDEAEAELKRHLALPTARWDAERATSMRFLAQVALRRGQQSERVKWLLRACAEAPQCREPWVELAEAYYEAKDHIGTFFAAKKALDITERLPSHITQDRVWGGLPHDLAAIGAWFSGSKFLGLWHAIQAKWHNPTDPRLANNLKCFQKDMRDPYATHQRLLAAAVAKYGGPVLECGVGHYSTPLLHGLCAGLGIKLVSLEKDIEWCRLFDDFNTNGHVVRASDWNDLPDHDWGVVFVDCDVQSRVHLIKQLLPRAKAVVVHDTEDPQYGFADLLSSTPHVLTDSTVVPHTSVLSNHPIDLTW